MRPELMPAIDALEEELASIERSATELRNTINMLCMRAGLKPRHAESTISSAPSLAQLKPDTFYGKKMQTAAREYLEMRKRAEIGPATPKEIYTALAAGGFQFDTKDENNAVTSLRGTLRKNSATFHKLPNGQYGLRSWYPNAKAPKADDEQDSAATAPKRGRARKAHAGAAKPRKGAPTGDAVREWIVGALGASAELSLDQMKARAAQEGLSAGEGKSIARALNANLMSMQKRRTVEKRGSNWRLAGGSPASEAAH